jgi:hypothetical protein
MVDKHAASTARQVDMGSLPDGVVDFITGLAPGEMIVLTRAGAFVATVTVAGGPLEGVIVSTGEDAPAPPTTDRQDATVVATAMMLSQTARSTLSEKLGDDYVVLDMHAAPQSADVLLVPPISAQLLGRLRYRFPVARIVVTELEDPELGLSYRGPVRRLLDSGADTYVTSASVQVLARQLDQAVGQREITGGSSRSQLGSAD